MIFTWRVGNRCHFYHRILNLNFFAYYIIAEGTRSFYWSSAIFQGCGNVEKTLFFWFQRKAVETSTPVTSFGWFVFNFEKKSMFIRPLFLDGVLSLWLCINPQMTNYWNSFTFFFNPLCYVFWLLLGIFFFKLLNTQSEFVILNSHPEWEHQGQMKLDTVVFFSLDHDCSFGLWSQVPVV